MHKLQLCFSEVHRINVISQVNFNESMKFEKFQDDETLTQEDIIWQIKNTGNDRKKYFGNNWMSVRHNNLEYQWQQHWLEAKI